jgi:hypothetical protein
MAAAGFGRISEHQLVHYLRYELTYADAGLSTGVKIGTLPKTAQITDIVVLIGTAFNAGTTNPLTIGTTPTGVDIAAATDTVSGTLGAKRITTGLAAAAVTQPTGDVPLYAAYIPTGTAATAGTAVISIMYTVNHALL